MAHPVYNIKSKQVYIRFVTHLKKKQIIPKQHNSTMSRGLPVNGLVYDPLKERVDRFALSQVVFDDFQFDAKLVDTVVRLLDAPEEMLVIKALQHLDQFAGRYVGHYDVLYETKLLDHLYGLLGDGGHIYRRRFAWKLLSQMLGVDGARAEILANAGVASGAEKAFAESNDNFLLEYSGVVLNHLTGNSPQYLDHIIESAVLPKVLSLLQSTHDSDVQLQCLQLLDKVTELPLGLALICDQKIVDVLVDGLRSEFLVVQSAALEALVNLTRSPAVNVRAAFESPTVMEKIFEILEVPCLILCPLEYNPRIFDRMTNGNTCTCRRSNCCAKCCDGPTWPRCSTRTSPWTGSWSL